MNSTIRATIGEQASQMVAGGFVKETHLRLLRAQFTLQLRDLRLQLLLSALPPLFALGNCSIHLYPELCSETILTLCPGGMQQQGELTYMQNYYLFPLAALCVIMFLFARASLLL